MTEKEFIKFYKKRNLSRSYKEVKEKIDLFWDTILKALVLYPRKDLFSGIQY